MFRPPTYKTALEIHRAMEQRAYLLLVIPLVAFLWRYLTAYSPPEPLVPILEEIKPIWLFWLLLALPWVLQPWAYLRFVRHVRTMRRSGGLRHQLDGLYSATVTLYIYLFVAQVFTVTMYILTLRGEWAASYALQIMIASIERPSVWRSMRMLRVQKEARRLLIKQTPVDDVQLMMNELQLPPLSPN